MAGQDSQKLYTKIFFGIVVLMLSGGMLLYLVPQGPGGTTTGLANDAVAKVGDQTITVNDVRQQVQQLTQRSQVPPQMMPFYEQEVLRRLLVEKEMDYEAGRLGITVSNDEIADRIRQILPAAFNGDVPIPPDQYTALVQGRTGMTVSQFEDAIRKGMLQEKFSKLVTDGISVGPAEIQQEFNYRNQKVKLDYAFIKPEDLATKITPTDAEIKAFYDKNKTRYQVPEKRVVQYAVVDVNQLRQTVQVPEAQLQAEYQKNIRDYEVPSRVHVEHILFNTVGKPDAESKRKPKMSSLRPKKALTSKNSPGSIPKTPAPRTRAATSAGSSRARPCRNLRRRPSLFPRAPSRI
jgi:peptidyl-prolyl cis-trans isomerase D